MGALSGRWRETERSTAAPPGYPALLWATLGTQLVCGLLLWLTDIGLSIARLAPGGGAADPFLPWQINGLWALAGAAGWAYLLSRLIARRIVDRLIVRGVTAPGSGWTAVAVAVGGYGALAVGHTTGIRVLLAAVITPLIIAAVAYTPDGRPRPWPVPSGRRTRVAVATAAVLVSLAYSVPHSFSAPGSGGSYATGVTRLTAGGTVEIDIGLSDHLLPTELTGVTLDQAGVVRSVILSGAPGTLPGGRLPAQLAAGEQWLTMHVGISCPASPTTISHATLHYRVLGISTSQRIALGESVRLACRH
jgi:hypothetical protein